MRLTPAQSQAARVLLNWSQKTAAEAAGLGETTVREFEEGARVPLQKTRLALWSAYYRSGVRFPEDGVLLTANKPPPVCTVDLPLPGVCGWHMEQYGYGMLDNPYPAGSDAARQWADGYVRSMEDRRQEDE